MAPTDQCDTIGIIFPISEDHVERFFNGKKSVFVKFFGRDTIPERLQKGSRLFFYQSRSKKEVVGEAMIADVTSGRIEEMFVRYGDDLFLTRSELQEYAGTRKAKSMLVLVLQKVRRYTVPLRLDKSVTMAGQYMTKKMLENLRAK